MEDTTKDTRVFRIEGMLPNGEMVTLGVGNSDMQGVANALAACQTGYDEKDVTGHMQIGSSVFSLRAFVGIRFVEVKQ